MRIITLLTDFGLRDGYAGVLKGVIWQHAPQVQIVDLSHDIAPQNVLEGTLALERCAPYFPPGTIHLAAVDPGVGTDRLPLAADLGGFYFVGPDNGLITTLVRLARRQGIVPRFFHLNQKQFWLPEVSNSFHARDIFAPVAAHLANGVPLEQLGSPLKDAVIFEIPMPSPKDEGWRGEIIHIDHFGNLATNLRSNHLAAFTNVHIHVGEYTIRNLSSTYHSSARGDLIAMIDSAGYLAICVVDGSAADFVQAKVGDPVEVHITTSTSLLS